MSTSSPHPHDLERLLAHGDWLKGLARALTRDSAEAEELEQETWLAALRHSPQRREGDLRGWLATVARNLARRRRRDASRRADHEQRVPLHERFDDPAAVAERVAWQRELADRVLALPEPLRTAVALRYFDGLEHAEIARRLGITPENARQRVARGLASLREGLDRAHGSRAHWCALIAPMAVASFPRPAPAWPPTPWKEWLAVKSAQRVALLVALLLAGWLGWSAWHGGTVRTVPLELADAELDAPREQPAEPAGVGGRVVLASVESPGTPPPAAPMPSAQLVFLVHPTGPAPAKSRWQLDARGGQEPRSLVIEVPDDGRVSIPAGAWKLSALGDAWSSATQEVELDEDAEELVWVGGQQTLDVLVVDARGQSIQGAQVDWVPWEAKWSPEPTSPSNTSPRVALSAHTDAGGRAALRWKGIVQGTLRAHRPGHPFVQFTLCGSQAEVVRVVLDEDHPEKEILVTDARTGLPRAGVELRNEATRAGVLTDHEGRARVRVSEPAQASFIVQGGGVFPMQVDPDGVSALRVTDASSLALRLGTEADAGERATLSLRIASVEPAIDGGPLLEGALSEVRLPAELDVVLPLGGHVELALVTAGGRGAWREIDVRADTSELAMELDDGEALRPVLTGPQKALAGARVQGWYATAGPIAIGPDDAPARIADAPEGLQPTNGKRRFTLPCASHLARVEIRAPGCAPWNLVRSNDDSVASGGELEIALRVTNHELVVTFVDETGLPVSGIEVRGSDMIQSEWFRSYPHLQGARPTSHAAWNLSASRGLPGRISAADGRVQVPLPSPANISLYWWLASAQSWTDGFPLIEFDSRQVVTPDTREVRWVVPRARRVTLHAVDAVSGDPIARFEVVDPDGATSVPGTGQGGVWQGWVPARARRLYVRASGERASEVQLPTWDPEQPNVTLRAELDILAAGILVLEGPAAEELRGRSLRLCAGKPGGQGGVAWQTVLVVEDPSRTLVALPLPEAVLGIQEESSAAFRYRFTPQLLSWRQGERIVFHVERR